MRITKPLTDADCRALKPNLAGKARPRIYDGGGLFLEALPSGRRVWRLKYKAAGRETKATFGEYPAVTLAAARRKRDEAKAMIADGLDVNAESARQKAQNEAKALAGTFEPLAREWFAAEIEDKSDSYKASVLRTLERGNPPISSCCQKWNAI
ncbi:MAG: Arm DNA-binding domain-containing protein [Panacagrimonas sp.]